MGMEIWFSVFTHNRFNFVKGFCSKFKLFESKPPQVILCPSRLFHFLRFPFSFALMFHSKQSPPNESCPVFLCHCFFWMPHIWIHRCWPLLISFRSHSFLSNSNSLCFTGNDDAQYNDFEVLFLFVRQCFNPPKFALNAFLKNSSINNNCFPPFFFLQYLFHSPSLTLVFSRHFWTVVVFFLESLFKVSSLKLIVKYRIFFLSCRTAQLLSLCFFNKSS